ncbi:MAG: mechanosensitive ion channel [Betaproteobacteria bacterium]|nr:mechanosensitive ion channel [Betaproteobacteria bacterium]
MPTPEPPHNLIAEFLREADTSAVLVQLAVIAGAGGLSWLAATALRTRLRKSAVGAAPFRTGGVNRILFPVMLWAALLAGRWALAPHGSTRLLALVVPLVSSLVIVRIAVYVLRYAFPSGSWLSKSERAVAWTVWIGVVLHLTGILPMVRAWLSEIELPLGKVDVSVLDVIEGTLSAAITIVGALWLGKVVERQLMRLQRVDVSLRVVLAKLLKAVLIGLGLMIALALAGIDLTVLSVFGGALGVGLGFGLQKIAANYVSGFAILLDRSIKLGDLVTIDNRHGEVTRLTARYVVVRSYDGTENIIPNETVITSTVQNHSYSDRQLRVDGTVQIAYDADAELALETLLAAARAHPRVLAEPAPAALVRGFGESGVDLEFFVWVGDPEGGRANLKSDLNLAILRAFREKGIEIPFPQRDVRIIRQPGNVPEGEIL